MSPVTSSRRAATSAARRHHRSRLAPNQSGVRAVVKRGRHTNSPILRRPAWDLGVLRGGGPQVSRKRCGCQRLCSRGGSRTSMTQRTTQAHYHVTHRSRVGLPQPVEDCMWTRACQSHATTNQAARFGNWAHAKRWREGCKMGFSDARGEFNLCRLWAYMRISPIWHANVAYWAGPKAEVCLRLEGGNITSISRLPPHAIVADAGVRLTTSLWARRSQHVYHKRQPYGHCTMQIGSVRSSLYIFESHCDPLGH